MIENNLSRDPGYLAKLCSCFFALRNTIKQSGVI